MPLQGSWVELWLGRYCAPGTHCFRALRADVLICERCFKEELTNGVTCLICGIPGEVELTLSSPADQGLTARGRLCGPCLDEFGQRHVIKGWVIAAAS